MDRETSHKTVIFIVFGAGCEGAKIKVNDPFSRATSSQLWMLLRESTADESNVGVLQEKEEVNNDVWMLPRWRSLSGGKFFGK
ncbi:MAG: hypothetical protein ACLTST_08520 [Lachnospiraceae bacterium]